MKKDNPLKHFALAFVLALVIYAVFYWGIEHRRTRSGPWQVTFTHDPAGVPAILINEPRLSITNVEIRFPEESVASTNATMTHQQAAVTRVTLVFSQPKQVPYDVPFGKCIFMDATFLPGTVTFQLFGHEIELLPRVLMIDHEERPWRSEGTITLLKVSKI